MKLRFLGTRAHIEARSRRHRRHSALEVRYRGSRVMVDCGTDWRESLERLRPQAIVVTHAHPDHAFGLKDGSPCPVYATEDCWAKISDYPIRERHVVEERQAFQVRGLLFEAFGVEHSTRAPAVAYRIEAGTATVVYAPDVAYIRERSEALRDVDTYIGDGASLTRSLIRKRGDALIGHAPVRTQLTWCQKEGVPKAVFTHCGSQIVEGDERLLGARLRTLAEERDVDAQFAHDGMEIVLR